MKGSLFGKGSRTKGGPRVLSVAMVAFVLAMMVLPLATPPGVAAEDDDHPKIKINGSTTIIDVTPDPTPTPSVPIKLPGDVDSDDDDTPVDVEPEETPQIKVPIDVDDDPQIDPPDDVDIVPDPPVIDLPDCVDTDGGEVIYLPGAIDFIDERTVRLPGGIDLDNLQDSPSIAELIAGLLGQSDTVIKLPPGAVLDPDAGTIFIPECEDEEPPVIKLPPGVVIEVEDDQPIIDLPTCVDTADGEDVIIRLPPGVDIDVEGDIIRLPEGVDLDFGDNPDIKLPPGIEFDGDGEVIIRLPEGVDIDVEGDDPIIKIPLCDDQDANTIVIVKRDCVDGFDAYNSDPDGLAAACDELLDDVTFNVSDGGPTDVSGATGADGPGTVFFDGLDSGEYVITESIPDGYGKPVVYCAQVETGDDEPEDYARQDLYGEGQIFAVLATDDALWCHWFNVPGNYEDAGDGGNVNIYKFECPVVPDLSGFDYDSTPEGCVPLPGIEFTLSYGINTILTQTTSDWGGEVTFSGLPVVTVSIGETLPAGYGDPYVTCLSAYQTDSGPVQDVFEPNLTGASFAYDLKDGENLYCYWLNIPYEDDGSITIVKLTCPAGYDLYEQGANPEYDCPDTTDGVVFSLDTPVDGGLQGVTGASGDGTVTFDDLPAGGYTIHEQVPAGTDEVFVLSCQSEKAKWVQGYPLATGSAFSLDLLGGDHIVCFWYNVPEQPDYGTITVVKYACPTATFQDVDDCEIYEDGASFHLSYRTGNGWVESNEGTTNHNGVLSWYGLEPGTYEIDEIGGTWCYATADRTDSDGNLLVKAGKETTVYVYNCGQEVITKKPTKFPNTGTGQATDTATGAHAPVSPAVSDALLDPASWMGVFDSRLIAPFLSPAKPAALRIESIDVNAQVETLEVVNGALQDPTTADKVAWYKDTAKLGEAGNVVMAGHLNYWGVPEGVFFRLADLTKGTEIEVVAQDGTVYRYRVEWVKQIDAFDGDVAKLVGDTKQPSLTLITCGGQWDASAQEYDHRTVVRATLVTEA